MSKLLFNEHPIVVSKELANLLGLNEAIVLQQIHYWLEINRKAGKHFHEGRHWTYNSIRNWHEENFEFWSFNTVQRTFAKLESAGLLLSGNFNKEPMDKTKWYSIDEKKLEKFQKPTVPKTDYDEKTPGAAVPPIEATHYPTPNEEVYCPAPHEPMRQLTPITPKCTNALPHSITPKWGNGLPQNGAMDYPKMGQAIPETSTETSTETSKKEKQGRARAQDPTSADFVRNVAEKEDTRTVQFAESVSMTNVEHEKLLSTYGETHTALMIRKLDNYKGSTGKQYKSDYRAILSWVADEVVKSHQKKETHSPRSPLALLGEIYEEAVSSGKNRGP